MLIENDMISNESKEIANILIITEGINKDILGKFFGSPNKIN